MRILAIGDIHGCNTALVILLNQVQPTDEDRIIFLGDYIDRGSASRDEIESLMDLSKTRSPIFLRGNHEVMILEAREDSLKANLWQSESGAGRLALDPDFARFVSEKKALTTTLAKKHEVTVPSMVWQFFDAAEKGDWETTTNTFARLLASPGGYGKAAWVPQEIWGPVHDTLGAAEQFHGWNPELLRTFGKGILGALTQNALADEGYLNYLRDMYGTHIYIPNTNDSADAFNKYFQDARSRLEKNQLMEGEDVKIVDDRVQVSGVGAVMFINELLCKLIVEKNPGREVYLEESYPLKSFYPQSVPHGFVLKINHQPVEHLSKEVIKADRKFWADQTRKLVGKVIGDNTTINELCVWSEGILVRSNFSNFVGNKAYLKDRQAPQYFSKCRSALASLYQWRSTGAADKAESSMLSREADHAHQEAVTLSPFNPEVAWRYTDYLISGGRTNEARVLIQTIIRIQPERWMELDSEYLKSSWDRLRRKAKDLGIPP